MLRACYIHNTAVLYAPLEMNYKLIRASAVAIIVLYSFHLSTTISMEVSKAAHTWLLLSLDQP